MPRPSDAIKGRIGPLQGPFERLSRRNGTSKTPDVGESEDFRRTNYDATDDGAPDGVSKVKGTGPFGREHRYLWIINDDGLFLQLEATPNPKAARKCLCHTNLTAGKKAYQGGELWFVKNDAVVINFSSGRYGADENDQMDAVVEYFEQVGYTVMETKGARDFVR